MHGLEFESQVPYKFTIAIYNHYHYGDCNCFDTYLLHKTFTYINKKFHWPLIKNDKVNKNYVFLDLRRLLAKAVASKFSRNIPNSKILSCNFHLVD